MSDDSKTVKLDSLGRPVTEKQLKALNPWTPETARKAQLNSVKSRKANKEARERLKLSVQEYNEYKEVLAGNGMSALDILKLEMYRAQSEGDYETVIDIAKTIAEFEQPKLQRVDSTNVDLDTSEMSDEQLKELIKKHGGPNPAVGKE